MDKKEMYRKRRTKACQKLFEGFYPDVSRSRDPETVLKAYELAKEGFYTKEIAELTDKSAKAIQKIYRRYNFPCLYNFCPPQLEERHDWKHGQKLSNGVYIYQRTKDHPNSSKHGNYVALHRLIMEKKLGRYLTREEVVDHIDGNPRNNHPDNLRVFATNAEHLRVTLKGKCPSWTKEGREILREKANDRRKLPNRPLPRKIIGPTYY